MPGYAGPLEPMIFYNAEYGTTTLESLKLHDQ